jgi:hypothetical protein
VVKGKIEDWIRFGRTQERRLIDSRRRVVSFAPDSVFAFGREGMRTLFGRHNSEVSHRFRVEYVVPGSPTAT